MTQDSSVGLVRNNDALYRQIVDIWRAKIMDGTLKAGDMLPSERDLASELNVSRIPVREAMKVLEYLGVVEHVRGKGVFVRQADPSQLLQNVGPMMTSSPTLLADLFEVRLLFEPHAAYLAALNAEEEDLSKIEDALNHMEAGILYGLNIESDSCNFHTAVMAASHNAVLLMVSSFLSELQKQSRHKTLRNSERVQEAHTYHKQIYEKIKARDSYAAADSMRKHLLNARNQLFSE